MISNKNNFINEFTKQILDVKSDVQHNKLLKYLVILGINSYISSGQALTYISIKRCAKIVQKKSKQELQDQVSQLKQQIKNLTQNVTNTLNGGSVWVSGSINSNSILNSNSQLRASEFNENIQNFTKEKHKKMNFEGLDIQEINRLFYENIESSKIILSNQNNQLFFKYQANPNATIKQNDANQQQQNDGGPLQQVELNSILSPKNTQKKMSFNTQRKQSHSIHTVSNISNAMPVKRNKETLQLNSFQISQSQYPNSLDQTNPLTSCKNMDNGKLKLFDFQTPQSASNSDFGILSSKNYNFVQQSQYGDKQSILNKENNSFFANRESKENSINSHFADEKKRNFSNSPLRSSNQQQQSLNNNTKTQIYYMKNSKNENNFKNTKNENTLKNSKNETIQVPSRKNVHQKNLNLYKQPCQKIQVNRSKSNPSRSNSCTPRNSKSPSYSQNFNGSNSLNQKPAYLRNIQSKIKDQIEFHKELKKNEKLAESQISQTPLQNQLKQNQDFSQSQGAQPSNNFSRSMNSSNSQQFIQNKNQNPSGNVLIMDNFQNQSKTLSLQLNNSSKNSRVQQNQVILFPSNNTLQDQTKSLNPKSSQNILLRENTNNQTSQAVTLQTSSHLIASLQLQQETLFTGHFRTKSNISEYQTTFEDQNSCDVNHISHQNLKHNQIKNMYLNSQNSENQVLLRSGGTDQTYRSSLERNVSKNPSPQRQRITSVIQTNPQQQMNLSTLNVITQQNQKSQPANIADGTLNGPKRKSVGQIVKQVPHSQSTSHQIEHTGDSFRDSYENKQSNSNNMPLQMKQAQNFTQNNQAKNQDQIKNQGKKNVLDIATNFLKSSIMQQLCNTKEQQQQQRQQQNFPQSSSSFSNLMNGSLKSQQQCDISPSNKQSFPDNAKRFSNKQEYLNNEQNSNSNNQQGSQPILSIQEQLQEQMKKMSFPKKHPCEQTLSPFDIQQLLNQNPNNNITANYQSADFGNSKNCQNTNYLDQSQASNIHVQSNYCSSVLNNNNVSHQATQNQNGDQSMVSSSIFSSFNPSNETKGFFQSDFEKRMNDLGKSNHSRRIQLSQNDVSSNISFNAGDISNNLIQQQVDNPFI